MSTFASSAASSRAARPSDPACSDLCTLLARDPALNVCAAAVDVLAEVGDDSVLPSLAARAARFTGTLPGLRHQGRHGPLHARRPAWLIVRRSPRTSSAGSPSISIDAPGWSSPRPSGISSSDAVGTDDRHRLGVVRQLLRSSAHRYARRDRAVRQCFHHQ